MATLLSNTARVTGAHFRRGRREGPLGRLPLPAPRTVFLRGRCRVYLGRLLDLFQSRRLQALLEQFGHGFNLASLRLKHLGANESFDKTQMQSYLRGLVILGDAELNAFFHLLGINSENSRLLQAPI
jgi:hypothetical protein